MESKPDIIFYVCYEFNTWYHYTSYVCILTTNGSCCYGFFDKAQALNPDYSWLDEVKELYRRIGLMWNNDNDNDLEALGGGFNITLEVLQDKEKCAKIAAVIRKCADWMDIDGKRRLASVCHRVIGRAKHGPRREPYTAGDITMLKRMIDLRFLQLDAEA